MADDTSPPVDDEAALRVRAAIVHLEHALEGRQSLTDATNAASKLLNAARRMEGD